MSKKQSLEELVKEIEKRFEKEMPRVRKEIAVYEKRLAKGLLKKNPKMAPQFNA